MSREEENWGSSDEKGSPMVVMPPRGSLGAAITRTAMNIFLILFMLFVVGLAVASYFKKAEFDTLLRTELANTTGPVRQVVIYSAYLRCARADVRQNFDFEDVPIALPTPTPPQAGENSAPELSREERQMQAAHDELTRTARRNDRGRENLDVSLNCELYDRLRSNHSADRFGFDYVVPLPGRYVVPVPPEVPGLQHRIDVLADHHRQLMIRYAPRAAAPAQPRTGRPG